MTVSCLEIPVDDPATAILAAVHADRLEICRELAREGLTPSPDLVARVRDQVATLADPPELAVLFQESPPPTDRSKTGIETFHGSDAQLVDLERLAPRFSEAGACGLVIGFLDARGRIDREMCRTAVEINRAAGLETAFHRAFDFAPDPIAAIRELSELGIRRTLSAGVRGFEVDAVSLEDRLAALADSASAGRAASPAVEVVPCGGVRCDHATRFLQAAGHLHASCLVAVETAGPRCFSLEEARGLRERIIDWTAGAATD
ncbi:MAG: copper homeostasis protein CutC [Phycisphaerales bacterium]|jgi:copper homeostasis protein|nr:copper homeostasis protein CutC [Phycisphaerales bacterium]